MKPKCKETTKTQVAVKLPNTKVRNTFKYHVFAPMGISVRINLPFFSTVVPSIICMFLSCPSQETEVTSTPTRPVYNVVITTKGLQDRNIHIIDETTVKNKGKLILTEIFPSVKKHDI